MTTEPDVLATYLRDQHRAIADAEPGVRGGDPDGVHDMRVAARRTRATLRTFRTTLGRDRVEALRAELRWLAGLLGGVRDADVQRARLSQDATASDPADVIGPVRARITEHLAARSGRAREALLAALDSDRYRSLVADLPTLVGELPPDPSGTTLRHRARGALRRADTALAYALARPEREPGVPLPGAPTRDTALHEARKAYKRARYAVEAVTPVTGRKARKLGRRLADLQDVLGDHHDGVAAAALLRDLGMRADAARENAFSYGLLAARETDRAERRLRDLPRARRRAGRAPLRAVLD